MDELNKILNDYISTYNKSFDFYFNNCVFVIKIDNNFIAITETIYFHDTDIVNIYLYLLYYTDCYESRGYKFHEINQMTININSDRCNMT